MQSTNLSLQNLLITEENLSLSTLHNYYSFTPHSKNELNTNNELLSNHLQLENANEYITSCKVIFNKENRHSHIYLAKSLNFINNANIPLIKLYEHELIITTQNEEKQLFDMLLFPTTICISLKLKLKSLVINKDAVGLKKLFYSFTKFIERYKQEKLIHGNLTDENIMVAENGEIVLTSFASHFTEDGKSIIDNYTYNNNFTHPDYKDSLYSNHLDDFTLLTIATSIYAYTVSPEMFTSLHCNNMLLFTYKDFKHIEKARIFTYIDTLKDDFLTILGLSIKTSILNKTTEIKNLTTLLNLNSTQVLKLKNTIEKQYYETSIITKNESINILKHNYHNQIAQNSENFILKENLETEKTFFQNKYLQQKKNASKSIVSLVAIFVLLTSSIFFLDDKATISASSIAYLQQPVQLKNNYTILLSKTEKEIEPEIGIKKNINTATFTKIIDNRNIGIKKSFEKTKTINLEKTMEHKEPSVVFKEISFSE